MSRHPTDKASEWPRQRTESGVPTYHGKHDATNKSNSTNPWAECKAHGDKGENKVADLLRRIGCVVTPIAVDVQRCGGGDLLVSWPDGRFETLEVKTDQRADSKGNLAVELCKRMLDCRRGSQ
jgi:hypothetical protein